ncbi:MAG: hypothetical protein IJP48_02690 [Synergistaceae bacterium]|nr:hypothetical protein [Synergistaceae bacterium]
MWAVRIDKSVDKRLKRIPNPDNKRIKQALLIFRINRSSLTLSPLKAGTVTGLESVTGV